MKKSFILLVAFAAMVFASCSKDDDDPSNEVGSITMTTFNEINYPFYFYTAQNEVITIDWGDGIIEEYRTVKKEKDDLVEYVISARHSYSQKRGHTIKVTGKLTGLDCTDNKLTSLDISKCRSLQELDCRYNDLTSLDVSRCVLLRELWCHGNEITSLDISKCTALTGLLCSSNQLTVLDISKCTVLTRLECDDNSLSSDALNKIFNDLPKGKTWEEYNNKYQSTIYINGNPGTETCDWSIAKNKGWEISRY